MKQAFLERILAARRGARAFATVTSLSTGAQAIVENGRAEGELPLDRVIDHLVDALRAMVEGRQRRKDHAAHLGHGRHVTQVREDERRLAHHQHQPAPFLQHHIRGTRDQVVR